MGNIKEYELKLPEITAIKDIDIIVSIKIPVSIYLQEAENLFKWCQPDKQQLINGSLNWSLVEDIPVRTGALREAEIRWRSEYNNYRVQRKEWKRKSQELLQIRNSLLHDFRFAYRNDSHILQHIKTFARSNSCHSMIQSLNDLVVFGKKNSLPLKTINFDLLYLDTVADLSQEMAILYAQAHLADMKNTAKKIRDQAYTYLKFVIDEVYRFGQYIFWNDDDRRRGYSSNYLHKIKIKAKKKNKSSQL